jgi:hypothetical protein
VNGVSTVQWGDSSGNTESSIYDGSTFTTINVPGAVSSYAHGIDSSGNVVYSWSDSGGVFHGAGRLNGKYTKFNAPGCVDTYADGINDQRVVVGVCQETSGFAGFYVIY